MPHSAPTTTARYCRCTSRAESCATSAVCAGRVRAIAVTSPERWFTAPEIPAIAETVPGFQAMSWHGVAFPAGTPAGIVNKLADAIRQAMTSAEMKEKFAGGGSKAIFSTPREFATFIKEDTERWAPVIRASGARVE